MRFGMVVGLAIGLMLGLGAISPEVAIASDGDAFQGVWMLYGGEADGKALSAAQLKGGKLVIHENQYTVTLDQKETVTGKQKLGSAHDFKTIDITDESGAHAGKTCHGIYEIKDNEFCVVFAPPGGERPSKFATRPHSGEWM